MQKLRESLPDMSRCPPSDRGSGNGRIPLSHPFATRDRSYVPGSLHLMLTWDFESGTSSCSLQLQRCSAEMAAVPGVTVSLPTGAAKRCFYILPFLIPRAALVPANFPSLVLRPQANIVTPHYPSVIIVSVSFCHLQPRTLTVAWGWALELSTSFHLSHGTSFAASSKTLKHSKPQFLSFCKKRIRILQSCC